MDGEQCMLYWENRKHQLTVLLGHDDNVTTFQLAPSYHAFQAFCKKASLGDDQQQDKEPIVFQTCISNDEGDK